jgi:hypothetical protein
MNFPINSNKININLISGQYNICIIGEFYIKANDSFKAELLNNTTNEKIIARDFFLKERTYRNSNRAVKYFDCNITTGGVYELSIHNFSDLIVKKSRLWLLRQFQTKIEIEQLEICIDPK